MVPAKLRGLALPFAFDSQNTFSPADTTEFHLHPHYRSQTSLDATVLKTQSGLDEFVTEKYHDQIAVILEEWRASLLQSPRNTLPVEKILASDFSGSSFRPIESRAAAVGSDAGNPAEQVSRPNPSRTRCVHSGIANRHEFLFATGDGRVSSGEHQRDSSEHGWHGRR